MWMTSQARATREAPAQGKIAEIAVVTLLLVGSISSAAVADPKAVVPEPTSTASYRQALDEAWFTGPLDAPNPTPIPVGHFYAEPYLLGAIVYGAYDGEWNVHRLAHNDYSIISSTLLETGIFQNVSLAVLPEFGYNTSGTAENSSGIRCGDFQVRLKWMLHQFKEGSWMPTLTLAAMEVFPTGSYDNLGSRRANGFGSGAYTSRFALYSQKPFWLPNGRILRARFDLTANIPIGNVGVDNVSVYGTTEGFRGEAKLGNSYTADLGFEYSVTSNWIAVMEFLYQHGDSTLTIGDQRPADTSTPVPFRSASGSSEYWSVAPAVEYNFNANVGIIAGAEVTFAGRNTAASVTPQIALSWFF
jgi:hypothetical protein